MEMAFADSSLVPMVHEDRYYHVGRRKTVLVPLTNRGKGYKRILVDFDNLTVNSIADPSLARMVHEEPAVYYHEISVKNGGVCPLLSGPENGASKLILS